MKKLCAIVLLIILTLSVFPLSAAAGEAYVQGDADSNGSLTPMDVLVIKKHLAGQAVNIDPDAADANGDGAVTPLDALALRYHFAGRYTLSERYPIDFGTVGRIRIAGVNIARYSIVVSDKSNENMVFAADELSKYIKEATGTALPTDGTSDSPYRIVLCADETGTLGDDGFSLSVEDGVLTVLGGAKRGTMYGVYELIEKYIGYRFFGYNDVYLADAGTIDIPEGLRDTQIPDTTYRSVCINPFSNSYTYSAAVKRKLNSSTDNPSLHKAKYGYGIERLLCNAHSLDYFVPYETKPCLSSDETFETCIENMYALIDARIAAGNEIGKQITEISCSYGPYNQYCECYMCRKIYREEGSHAGVLVDFVNMVDDCIQERYDGITVITNAYSVVRKPPKTKTLNEDVILLYCWNGCANHLIGSGECSDGGNALGYSNKVEEEYYLGWTEHASRIYVWYYPTNIYYMLAPLSNFENMYNDMRWFMEHKAVGFYTVGTAADSFEGMMAYLASRLMWNKDISYDEYLTYMQEYMAYYFGEGWEYIYRYTQMLTEAGNLQPCFMNDYDYPLTMYSSEYLTEHFGEMRELFASAIAAANDTQKDRLERLSAHMQFLCYAASYESVYKNPEASQEQKDEYAQGYREWYDYVNSHSIRVTYEQTGISEPFTLEVSPSKLVYGLNQ